MSRYLGIGGVLAATSVIVLGTSLATIPTPLYPLYERETGLDALGITATFAAFAGGAIIGLVAALLASARLPRRWAYVIAAGLQASSALLMALDLGLAGFAAGRVITGIGSGLLAASGTAFVMELALGLPARAGGIVRAGAPALAFLGLGLGPAVAALALPSDTAGIRLLFLMVGVAVSALLAVSIRLLPADAGRGAVTARAGVRTRLPWAAGAGAFAAFMTTGLFGSVTTALLSRGGVHDALSTGIFAAAVFAAGAVGVVAVAPRVPHAVSALSLGVGLLAVAATVSAEALPALAAAALFAGSAAGVLFARSLRLAVTSAPHAAFRQTVAVFLCAYVGLAVPVLGLGLLSRVLPLHAAVWIFAGVGAAVCASTVIASHRTRAARAQAPVSQRAPSLG